MRTIAIEALTPLYRTSRIKLYKNIARSRLFCRIAKRSIPDINKSENLNPKIVASSKLKIVGWKENSLLGCKIPQTFTQRVIRNTEYIEDWVMGVFVGNLID